MAEMKTEEEQVEALKSWWKDNGKSLILTIAVALGGVLSWNAYQDHQVGEAEAASVYFQELMNNAPHQEAEEGTEARGGERGGRRTGSFCVCRALLAHG